MKQAGRFFLLTMVLVFVAGQPVLGGEAGASLHDLQLSEGPPEAGFMGQALAGKLPEGKLSLTPAFKPAVDTYTVTVSQPLLTIRARAAAGVKMSVSGMAPGGDELRVANRFSIGNANDHGAFMSATLSGLDAGENVITVKVSDSGGTETQSYSLTVTRNVTAEKAPVGLDDLQLSEGAPRPGFMFSAMAGRLPEGDLTVTPAFEPQVTSYAANVSQPLVTVRARAAAGAEMRVTGTAAGGEELTAGNRSRISNSSGHGAFLSVTLSGLAAGENLVTVEVTDPDGAETRGYKVVLTRVAQSAGDTARSAQTTKALQAPEAVRPGPEAARQAREERRQEREKARQAREERRQEREKARQAREERLQEREKARQARREARQAREEARKARREARRAGQTDASSDQKGQDLLSSIRYKDADGVRRAIEAGENVNEIIPGKTRVSPLLLAVDKEDTEIVRLLIDAGADANYILPKQSYQSSSSTGISALLMAVNKENAEIVRLLVEAGADVNHVLPEQGFQSNSSTGISALLVAVNKENAEIVRLLVEAGADVNHVLPEQALSRRSETGTSALLLAVGSGNEKIVRLLIAAGADLNYALPDQGIHGNKTVGMSALLLAVNKGYDAIVRLLIEAGADVNHVLPKQSFSSKNETGMSALLVAVKKGNEEIVQALIEAGADVNYSLPKQDFQSDSIGGLSALLLAISESNEAIVRLLIEAGGDVNATLPEQGFTARKSTGGVSALILAVNSGQEKIVRLLIEAGADVSYQIPGDRRMGKNPKTAGLTALRVAKAKDHSGIAELLRKAGAKR